MADLTERAYEALVEAQDALIAALEVKVNCQRDLLRTAYTRMSNVVSLLESANPTIAKHHDYVQYARDWVAEFIAFNNAQ